MFWDPIYVTERHAYRGAKVEDHLRYRGPRARDSGREAEETEPGRHANCDGTIIRLLRVRALRLIDACARGLEEFQTNSALILTPLDFGYSFWAYGILHIGKNRTKSCHIRPTQTLPAYPDTHGPPRHSRPTQTLTAYPGGLRVKFDNFLIISYHLKRASGKI